MPTHGADLSSHTALVTGAGRGMGRAIAAALASQGATVFVNDVRDELLDDTVSALSKLGARVERASADITQAAAVAGMFQSIEKRGHTVDIVVNNAGILYGTPARDISFEEWSRVIAVNLTGTFLVSQASLGPMMGKRWGRIINMSSTAGKNVSTIGGLHYTASKAGMLGVTRHLAKEVAAFGITVNAICPGLIDTDMVRETISKSDIARYEASFPIKRLGQPSEVASVATFLCKDESSYITGASIDVNGGDLMI